MPSHDFEVWQGDRAPHKEGGARSPRPCLGRIGRLARRFNLLGILIAVKDETGGLAILVGAHTAQRMLFTQAA